MNRVILVNCLDCAKPMKVTLRADFEPKEDEPWRCGACALKRVTAAEPSDKT